MSLGKTLADLRKAAGLTQTELGEKLSISAQAISKWENDISEPDISTIRKIAEIYGVSAGDIISSDSKEHAARSVGADRAEDSAFENLYDVYLTDVLPNKLAAIKDLRHILGFELKEAKDASEDLPYLISGKLTADEVKAVENIFANSGAKTEARPATGANPRREINTKLPEPTAEHKRTNTMKKRFIVANATAAIPAIAIFALLFSSIAYFVDVLLVLWLSISAYSLVFLLWYPTVVRKLIIAPLGFIIVDVADGFFGYILAFILLPVFFLWALLVGLISPIFYSFSIKKRVVRMLEDDWEDDVFFLL